MTEFDDMLTDIDLLGDALPEDTFDDLDVVDPVDPDLATTDVWTAEVWWEFDTVETEVAGASIVLPDPFQPTTGFSAGIAVGGWLARRRARRAARAREQTP
jgi:hypothetical protein